MKIILLGYGKMGKTIERLSHEAGDEIVATISSAQVATLTDELLQSADVVIEFTQPEAAVSNILKCFAAGVPVVSGTTGWFDQLDLINSEAEKQRGALVWASNFSVGVNLFFELNRKMAALMRTYPEYSVSIEETHHTQKKDSPSGTAKTLLAHLQEFYPSQAIPVVDHRIDPVVGIHTTHYHSKIDSMHFTHEAHSRDGFAAGALMAAKWLIGKKGVFTMKDVIS